MRESKVLFLAVSCFCAMGIVKITPVEGKNIFSFKSSEENSKTEIVQKPSSPKVQIFTGSKSVDSIKPTTSMAMTAVNVTPPSSVSAKPQTVQVADVGRAQIDTPRGAHLDKGKFEGMADHAGMRDHLPTEGIGVAGKNGEDAFTGRGDSGIMGADGNPIGVSRSSGLTGADGNSLWDPSGGQSGGTTSAGTEMTDQYGRSFTRGEGGSGKSMRDPHTGESREIGGRGGSGVSDSDRAAMNDRNSIAGDNSSDSGGSSMFSIDKRATAETVVYDGRTLFDINSTFGDSTTSIRKGQDTFVRITSGSDESNNMSVTIETYDRRNAKTTTVVIVEGQEVVVGESYAVGDDPVWVKEVEDDPVPVSQEEGKAHPDSLGDGGKAGKIHPDSVDGGGIASSEGVDSMGSPDGWFMPAPDDVGGGGVASSTGKAGKPAGDSLDIGGIASSVKDADLRALILSGKAGKMNPESLGTGGVASTGSAVTTASSSAANAQVSAQVASKLDAVQIDAPVAEAENVEGPVDIDNN